LGNFRLSGLGISTLGPGKFQDMVFRTWDLNFGAWEILGYGFQDMVFRTWDLNFGAWISHTGLHSGLRPQAPTSSLRCQQEKLDIVIVNGM
jgi:hypothetical protein